MTLIPLINDWCMLWILWLDNNITKSMRQGVMQKDVYMLLVTEKLVGDINRQPNG
jgi:hypothetical protein